MAEITLEQSVAAWVSQRAVIVDFVQKHLTEGVDFYKLMLGGRETKPSLSKAGAEKFLGLFSLAASFEKDTGTWEMFGSPSGVICYVCSLHNRDGVILAEGRGAAKLDKNQGDPNKTVKMSLKSSMIDAVIRYGALSDIFTQDIEDMQEQPTSAAKPEQAKATGTPVPQKASPAPASKKPGADAPRSFTATELVPDKYGWKLKGEDIPVSRRKYGMSVSDDVLRAAGLPIEGFATDEPTQIGRYHATYTVKPSNNPNFPYDPDVVIALVDLDSREEDIPF